jgi:hypothetical protein
MRRVLPIVALLAACRSEFAPPAPKEEPMPAAPVATIQTATFALG